MWTWFRTTACSALIESGQWSRDTVELRCTTRNGILFEPLTFIKQNISERENYCSNGGRLSWWMQSRNSDAIYLRKPYIAAYKRSALNVTDANLPQRMNAAIIRMGFGGELVAHGMRSIARTAALESGKFRIESSHSTCSPQERWTHCSVQSRRVSRRATKTDAMVEWLRPSIKIQGSCGIVARKASRDSLDSPDKSIPNLATANSLMVISQVTVQLPILEQ